jgi:hypothetical protein
MPKKTCLDTATGKLCVTLMSLVVVNAPAERVETFLLSPLSPSLLCVYFQGYRVKNLKVIDQ